jgi:dihydrofolate reductase
MRKLVLYTLLSLDGAVDDPSQYFAGSDRGKAPAFDEAMIQNEAEIIGTQDTVLLGRHMFDEWAGYWPTSGEQPFADFINAVEKVVVTSRPLTRTWTNATAVPGPIEAVVRDLKAKPGRDIGVHGSIELARSLLEADLVDELRLVVGPTIGHGGRRLFSPERVRRLALLSARSSPSGTLLLAYGRAS